MTLLTDFLVEHGSTLTLGVTGILFVGWSFVLIDRQPIHKQRLAELSVIAAVLWLGLAALPWPSREPPRTVESASKPDRRLVDDPPSPPAAVDYTMSVVKPKPRVVEAMPHRVPPGLLEFDGIPSLEWTPSMTSSIPLTETPAPALDDRRTFDAAFAARFYLASVGLAMVTLSAAWLRLRRLVRRAKRPTQSVLEVWDGLTPPKAARLLVGPSDSTPMSFGVLKPTVCIPSTLTERGGAELEAVLRHELAHLRHRDSLSRMAFNSAMPLFALHPLYWLLRRQAMFAAELRADAGAAEPVGAEHYVEALVGLFNQGGRPRRLLAASTVWTSESEFCRRMTMLLKRDRSVTQRTSWTWRTAAVVFAAIAVTLSANQFGVVYAQTAKPKSAEGTPMDPVMTTAGRSLPANLFADSAGGDKGSREKVFATGQLAKAAFDSAADLASNDAGEISEEVRAAARALTMELQDLHVTKEILDAYPSSPEVEIRKAKNNLETARVMRLQSDLYKRIGTRGTGGHAEDERKLRRILTELDEAKKRLGPDHPTCTELKEKFTRYQDEAKERATRNVKRRQEWVERCRTLADDMQRQAEQKLLELSNSILDHADLKRLPSDVRTQDATPSSGAQTTKDDKWLIHRLREENAALRQQFHEQNRVLAASLTLAAPPSGPQSIPYLKHQLRMAEAEPLILQRRLEYYKSDLVRIEKMRQTGSAGQAEFEKSRMAVETAEAELRKALVEIDSLKSLIMELEKEASSKSQSAMGSAKKSAISSKDQLALMGKGVMHLKSDWDRLKKLQEAGSVSREEVAKTGAIYENAVVQWQKFLDEIDTDLSSSGEAAKSTREPRKSQPAK
jgi:hypothetical protein